MKSTQAMTPELVWDYSTSDIPDAGLEATRTAAPDELNSVARALDIVACESLVAMYSIMPSHAGRYVVAGSIRARVVQACVVTLDPVATTIVAEFRAAFWPEEEITLPKGGVLDFDEDAEPEPIVKGQIGVGRVVFECLAENLEPYPRKPGATLDWQEPAAISDTKPESPFSVLANIKTKR